MRQEPKDSDGNDERKLMPTPFKEPNLTKGRPIDIRLAGNFRSPNDAARQTVSSS